MIDKLETDLLHNNQQPFVFGQRLINN